jgi:predicted NBD/HSP70 family sugar kinase
VGAARARESRSYRNVVYLDWSQGMGAGLILGGELYRCAGVAGEIGHAITQSHGPRPQLRKRKALHPAA